MERNKKFLKLTSYAILLLAILSLLNVVAALFSDELNSVPIPADAPENTLLIAKIVIIVISLLILLPQIYVGLKGVSFAKKPDSSRAHIVWAKILFVLAVLAMISPIIEACKGNAILTNCLDALSSLAEVILFFDYIKFAKALQK